MPASIPRAIQLRDEARLAEDQGNIDRAEVLYVESKEIFMNEGGAYLVDTAMIMNAIASMKEKYKDYAGALRAAEKSIQILKNHIDSSTGPKADEIRLQAWLIIGRMRRHLAQHEEAERTLVYALNQASHVFGETDKRTEEVRHQLARVKESK
jgi:tetratricopeptide (TPR) repeat protein